MPWALPALMLSPGQALVPCCAIVTQGFAEDLVLFCCVSCWTSASCWLPIAPGEADLLQGAGVLPAWHLEDGLVQVGITRFCPCCWLAVPHGISGPSGLAPCRSAVLAHTGEACSLYVTVPVFPRVGETVCAVLSTPRSLCGLGKNKGM